MNKLILITNELAGGGAERVLSVLANDFVNRGIEVIFLALKKTSAEYALDPRVKVIYKEDNKKSDVIGQIRTIRQIMKANPGATVLSFFVHQSLYTILASIGLNVRVVVSERNDPAHSIHGKGKGILRRILYESRLCDSIVFQTNGAAKYFSKKIQLKSIVIPNPIKDGLPTKYSGARKHTVVSVSRLESQKNIEMLIYSFLEFSREFPDYSLVIFGKGSQQKELESLAETLQISNKVVFAGFNKDVHREIVDAGMFVLSSDYEGLSNSMLEAMAIGLPVICTDCPPGGARMFIKPKVNGLLVPVGDRKALADAMKFMAENPQLANEMGNKAYLVRTELESSKICDRWKKTLFPEEK